MARAGPWSLCAFGVLMAYDRPHYLLSVGGTAITGREIWQTGLRFAPQPGSDVDDLVFALTNIGVNDIFTAFGNVIGNSNANLAYPAHTVLRFAKLAILNEAGKYAAEPKIHEGTIPGKGVAQTGATPPQLAWCATLGTGRSFGTAQRGRMYFPVPYPVVPSLDGTLGTVPTAIANQFRDLVVTAITAAEGEVSTVAVGAFAAVMSKSGGVSAPLAGGSTNAVTEVSVGNVIDTQRRRRGELIEIYTPAPAARGLREQLLAPPSKR